MSHHHDDCEICYRKTCSCNNDERQRESRKEEFQQKVRKAIAPYVLDSADQMYLVIESGKAHIYTKENLLSTFPRQAGRDAENNPNLRLYVGRFDGITI